MFYFYILYSENKETYYIGHTANLRERLRKHNANHKGFTGSVSDWKLVYTEEYSSKLEAYARERQVKKWKSRKAIVRLIKTV